ncbi:conserved exported hypothetical protein [uncultured Desulfovibrio sp.]|uniref:Uncharacterized protein n=1 Tax=uncultured Desulfovibrio sp. TaxID=167968 RepID=A0A212KEP9_9BACT|nr:hypothetical protein [uncultured Desulfovibrio sp.]SBW10111.1 conserved exported hypothetical protein [uncultured Desulfovibrio sp.]
MTTGIKAALTILGVLLILAGGSAGWQTLRLEKATARVDALVKDVASAKADTERWEAEAKRLTTNAKVQATLAEACLKREAKAQEEATAIADIMSQTVPKEITPEQTRQGVDDATRKRAADMLNRPW